MPLDTLYFYFVHGVTYRAVTTTGAGGAAHRGPLLQ